MIIYDILYQVSTTAIDLVVVFALFVFMLVLLCFCVATVFSVNKDLCIIQYAFHNLQQLGRPSVAIRLDTPVQCRYACNGAVRGA